MARNRKNETTPGLVPILGTLALCTLFAGLGVGYVWYKNQVDVLGNQIKKCEVRLGELQRDNKMRREQLAILCSPKNLDARVKQMNLGLAPPALSQVIRLVEAPDVEQAAQPLPPPSKPPPRPAVKIALAVRKN